MQNALVQQYPRFLAKVFCESSSFDLVRLLPKIAEEIKVLEATAPSLMPPTLKVVVVLAGAIVQAEEKKEPSDWSESFQNDMKEANLSLVHRTKLLTSKLYQDFLQLHRLQRVGKAKQPSMEGTARVAAIEQLVMEERTPDVELGQVLFAEDLIGEQKVTFCLQSPGAMDLLDGWPVEESQHPWLKLLPVLRETTVPRGSVQDVVELVKVLFRVEPKPEKDSIVNFHVVSMLSEGAVIMSADWVAVPCLSSIFRQFVVLKMGLQHEALEGQVGLEVSEVAEHLPLCNMEGKLWLRLQRAWAGAMRKPSCRPDFQLQFPLLAAVMAWQPPALEKKEVTAVKEERREKEHVVQEQGQAPAPIDEGQCGDEVVKEPSEDEKKEEKVTNEQKEKKEKKENKEKDAKEKSSSPDAVGGQEKRLLTEEKVESGQDASAKKMKIVCEVADVVPPEAEETYAPVHGDVFELTVVKRKDIYEGQQVMVMSVNKNNWRCEVLTGPNASETKYFLPVHVKKWLKQSGGVGGSSTVKGPGPVDESRPSDVVPMDVDGTASNSAAVAAAKVLDLYGNLSDD
jgi:hypothetical protein